MKRVLICYRGRLPESRLSLNRSHRQFCPKRRRLPALSSEQQFLASPSHRFPSSCWIVPSRLTPAGSPGLRLVPTGSDWPRGARTRPSKLWDVPTGQETGTVATKIQEVQALAFSRDGHWLAAENSINTVTLWDATTRREVRTFPSNKPLGVLGSSWVYSIAFSPDGRLLASGVDDKTIKIWEVATGKEIQTLRGHKKNVYAVVFSSNGRYLASASADKSVKLWDVTTGREIHTLTGHASDVSSIAFSPDSRWLASGSWDKTIKIWRLGQR